MSDAGLSAPSVARVDLIPLLTDDLREPGIGLPKFRVILLPGTPYG